MTLPDSRRLLLAVILTAGIAACGEQSVTTPPVIGGPVIPGTWYLQTANGDTLPAKISERIVGVAQEVTFLDSARLIINADLTYQQRYWTRVLVTNTLDRADFVLDFGTFTASGSGYRLTSDFRAREFTMVVPSLGNLTTTEQMLFFANAPPTTTGRYRLSPP